IRITTTPMRANRPRAKRRSLQATNTAPPSGSGGADGPGSAGRRRRGTVVPGPVLDPCRQPRPRPLVRAAALLPVFGDRRDDAGLVLSADATPPAATYP